MEKNLMVVTEQDEKSANVAAPPVVENGMTENVHITNSILSFLQSEPGSKLAGQIVTFFQEWKNQTIAQQKHTAWLNASFQIIILGIVLGTATYTTITGKMDSVLAGLLGTLAGYVLGRKTSE